MNLSESKDFLVSSASLKDVRTFSREVFDKINLPQEQKDELVLAIAEAAQNIVKHAYNNEQTDVKTMVDVFNAIKQNTGTDKSKMESGVGKPPYLSFSEYLTANAGKVGAYQFDLEKELESRKKDPEDVTTPVKKTEAEEKFARK